MVKRLIQNRILGLCFTIASSVMIIILGLRFFNDPRLLPFLFDSGVNFLGSLICAALFFGCMKQEGDGTRIFRWLIILVSAGFASNEIIYYTVQLPEQSSLCFTFCLISKLIDLVMIYLFYLYVRVTLNFTGKLIKWADRGIPILMVIQGIIMLTNIFYPITFMVNTEGVYKATGYSWVEDIYLAMASIVALILIFKSHSTVYQKIAALTFILFPLIEYALLQGQFGNSSQYGFVLMSLIVMYCVIFNDKNKKLVSTQTELDMATEIQTSMIPSIFPAFPNRSEFEIYASMDPAKEVGGDFYDFFMIDEDHLAMVIADVSGKGVPAALFMMSSKILINDHAMIGGTPAEILERVNNRVCDNNTANMFVTVWLGILEISTGKLTTANAGHEYPMINTNGKYEILKDKHGLVIGAMPNAKYTNIEIRLKKGDSILVYTDGVAEATDENKQLFGLDRTLEALNAIPNDVSQKEILAGVRTAVDAFVKEAPQFDDLTMLGLRYNGPEK